MCFVIRRLCLSDIVANVPAYAMFTRGTICDQRELTTGKYGRSFAEETKQNVVAYCVLSDSSFIDLLE